MCNSNSQCTSPPNTCFTSPGTCNGGTCSYPLFQSQPQNSMAGGCAITTTYYCSYNADGNGYADGSTSTGCGYGTYSCVSAGAGAYYCQDNYCGEGCGCGAGCE